MDYDLGSMGIASVVDKETRETEASSGSNDAMCTACQMAVVWMQNQLSQNQTKEQILSYMNQVIRLSCIVFVHF